MRASLIALTLLAGTAARAASFDCAKATTPQEKAICASPALSGADDRMAAAYRKALADIPMEMREAIRADQRSWLRSRSLLCSSRAKDLSACLLTYENARAEDLQKTISREGGITFVWRSVKSVEADDSEKPAVNPGYGTMTASWPHAAVDAPEWKAWNRAIESEMGIEKETLVAEPDVDDDRGVSIDFVGKNLISVTIESMEYGHGAAHPMTNWVEYNWLLDKQRELVADDIFRAGSGWESMLESRTDEYLQGELEDSGGPDYERDEMPKVLRGIVTNPRNWRLSADGLSIVFQQYAVSSYAFTPKPFMMPWTLLKPYIRPEFSLPASRVD